MPERVAALKVRQWLPEWNNVKFDITQKRREPPHDFFILSISAKKLMQLSNIYRRKAEGPRKEDEAIQRQSSSERVEEIARFLKGGYPWSDISERQRRLPEYQDLKMPGWLPTAIVANALAPGTAREGTNLAPDDAVRIVTEGSNHFLELPISYHGDNWKPAVRPIEIIDGQHRLLAFQEDGVEEDFEVPVVIFSNLDITWQAYLFYTINIKPKKINTSLAFDLYPLLRIQDWLEKSSNAPAIYRETRAQEITEILWSHPQSVWRDKIAMLGEDSKKVSQAAFVRSLINSYVKKWDSKVSGGLFGGSTKDQFGEVLSWSRIQQSAFLLVFLKSFLKRLIKAKAVGQVNLERLQFRRKQIYLWIKIPPQ